ncbi:VpaChn25_0724 family phage protein [Alloalcanivorax xenomutans]
MSSKYANFLREDQRLVILRILCEMPAYSANSSVLAGLLRQYGHNASRDQVKTELHWLDEQGLAEVEDMDAVMLVKLTERGADVAAGRASVPGVRRPGA